LLTAHNQGITSFEALSPIVEAEESMGKETAIITSF